METQNRYATKYESHMFMMKETYEETDIKGNNNSFNPLKTETNINHAHEPSSLFQVNCTKEKKLEVDNSLFSYSSFKKAMDLRTHNRTLDGKKRTIFDDAEYFAKNYCYKLLPITFEQVDETIIQTEHNYSLSSLNSESEPEEDCSRTMDYSQVKEKNYKRRKTKFLEGEEDMKEEQEVIESETSDGDGKLEVESSSMLFHPSEDFATEYEHRTHFASLETENSIPVQPLDLSAPPLVQEEKTDHHLRERPSSIVENEEIAQPDSDKENVNSELSGIRVTITRPDEKENYQPCDLFLNDIARLVPWLINKDCFEVDILDRTCDQHDDFQNHRLYYVISETTWRLFQESNERIILTNDQSLGQPLTKADKNEKPSYLVFDQFSLAKCLADYCKEIGGCFEYSCIEEGKDEGRLKEQLPEDEIKSIQVTTEEVNEVAERVEEVEEVKENKKEIDEVTEREQIEIEASEKAEEKMEQGAGEKVERGVEEKVERGVEEKVERGVEEKVERRAEEKVERRAEEKVERRAEEKVERRAEEKVEWEAEEKVEQKVDEKLKTRSQKKRKKKGKEDEVSEVKLINSHSLEKEVLREKVKETVCGSDAEKKVPKTTEKKKSKPDVEEANEKRAVTNKRANQQIRGSKRRKKSPTQREPNNCRITTRSKSTSGSETSHKSDKPVSRKERKKSEAPTLPKEPPAKRSRPAEPEDFRRKTRSGKVLEEPKVHKSTGATEAKKRSEGSREKVKGEEAGGRRLRSHKMAEGAGESTVKTRTRKRLS